MGFSAKKHRGRNREYLPIPQLRRNGSVVQTGPDRDWLDQAYSLTRGTRYVIYILWAIIVLKCRLSY